MDYCRDGDELVVWKLDRFGRSLRELIDLVNELRERGGWNSCPCARA
jgi:DNA invertase Pin-like site-specific DNA recombinase